MKSFTKEEVSQHNKEGDLWIVVDNKVYDLSKFQNMHPGGAGILATVGGCDATEEFYELHRKQVLDRYQHFVVGTLAGKSARKEEPIFSKIPFGEQSYLQGWKNPYYNDHHVEFQKRLRIFLQKEIYPTLSKLEQSGRHPKKLYKRIGDAGLWPLRIGFHNSHGRNILGMDGDKFDAFHEKICHEEFARMALPGAVDGITAGNLIGTQPILNFAKEPHRTKITEEIFAGTKSVVLCITEPYVGSDVANLRCTAVKSKCGKFYIVNGLKKWITNGTFADYFTTAVRTGPKGMKGVSMLLVPKGPGVTTKKMTTSYSRAAGTALVCYDNAKVPVEYLLGKENRGFQVIVRNFNHERWMIVNQVLGLARTVVEECFRWANQRRVFGKNLLAQPVIRNKLSHMCSELESVSAWQDSITAQLNWMTLDQEAKYLAGPIALLKLRATTVCEKICGEAIQIFGGRAVTKQGMGGVVERARAACKIFSVYGGSEEIMGDLGIRQAMKSIDKNAKL